MKKLFNFEVDASNLMLACMVLFAAIWLATSGGLAPLEANARESWVTRFFHTAPEEPVDVDAPRKQAIAAHLSGKYKISPLAVRSYVDLAWKEAEKHPDVKPELILAIMQKESGLRDWVQNSYGAQGLMQVVRRWHPEKLDREESLLEPEVNVRVGAEILQEYIGKKNGNLPAALKKYSGNARGYAEFVLSRAEELEKI